MDFLDSEGQARLEQYIDRIGEVLGNDSRRGSFAMYAAGMLGEGDRKSVEPVAARACADPGRTDATHQRLLHFVANSDWSDADVRREAARYALDAMTGREPVVAWIVDDTGFLKQGKHSVGVQRQYTGSAGKKANCQIGVSLTVATPTEHLPVDFELYLPDCWTSDKARRAEARIPAEVEFKTKPELALDMVRRAVRDGLPRGVVLGDAGYGSTDFRVAIRDLGLHYALGVMPQTNVFTIPGDESADSVQIGVKHLAMQLEAEGAFRRCTWREGTRAPLSARFVRRRVLAASDPSEELWLLIEWRDGESEPSNSSSDPSRRRSPSETW